MVQDELAAYVVPDAVCVECCSPSDLMVNSVMKGPDVTWLSSVYYLNCYWLKSTGRPVALVWNHNFFFILTFSCLFS